MKNQLTRNFTLEELLKSDTADRWGFKEQYTPPENVIDNLKDLCVYILQPLRDELKLPIRISSGYRCPRVNAKIGGASRMINGKVTQTSDHCFDDKTEILTDNGWKNINDIDEITHVYSLNTENNLIELVEVDSKVIYDYEGELLGAKNLHVDYLVTPEHRMYCLPDSRNGKFKFELANEIVNKRRTYKVAGKINSNNIPENLTFLKLCMAVIADGCISKNTTSSSVNVKFSLVKERETRIIEEYLEELNITYYKHKRNQDSLGGNTVWVYLINASDSKKIVNIIGLDKKIPKFILEMSPEIIESLFIAYANFDGCWDKRDGCTSISITSIDKDNIDMLRTMSLFCGRRCAMSEGLKTTSFGTNYFYTINSSENDVSKVNEDKHYTEFYKGKVWCLNNKNTTLIIKRNNKISIQGNCYGRAADISVVINGVRANQELVKTLSKMIKSSTFEWDQIILENGSLANPSWIHISYRKGENRKQILRKEPNVRGYKTIKI
jgi:hypothetical protein